MVRLLLKSGADVKTVDGRMRTPLDLAGGVPPMNFFRSGVNQRSMAYLIEPLGVNQTTWNPLRAGRAGLQATASLIEAAGGKHSADNSNFRRPPGFGFPN